YHGSSPYRRAMGVSHPAFSRSRVYGIATHAGAVHPSFSWPALFISLGATGRSSHATGLAAKAWLPKRLGLHAAGRFVSAHLDLDDAVPSQMVAATGPHHRCGANAQGADPERAGHRDLFSIGHLRVRGLDHVIGETMAFHDVCCDHAHWPNPGCLGLLSHHADLV